jgi:inorganic pyrophosphatase
VKYELHKATGHLRIDRPQRYSSNCPTLYGFIPQTYCGTSVAERSAQRAQSKPLEGDGDQLDICVITEAAINHGDFITRARPVGGLRMIDGNEADDKIVAVLEGDVTFGHIRDVGELPPGVVERLKHYFLTYKQRPDEPRREVRIAEVYDRAEALEVIRRSQADYAACFGAPGARFAELKRLLAG